MRRQMSATYAAGSTEGSKRAPSTSKILSPSGVRPPTVTKWKFGTRAALAATRAALPSARRQPRYQS